VPIDAVGLINTLIVIGLPLEIPPLIPPLLFVLVLPDSSIIGSLNSEPFRLTPSKPNPNSTPFTPPIENNRCDIVDSNESKYGSPSPTGTPFTLISIIPPTESLFLTVSTIISLNLSGLVSPYKLIILVLILIPSASF